jgi:hypothetical protein
MAKIWLSVRIYICDLGIVGTKSVSGGRVIMVKEGGRDAIGLPPILTNQYFEKFV